MLFHRRSGCIVEQRTVAASLVIGGVLLALATPSDDERRPFSIAITSPLGRTGLPGPCASSRGFHPSQRRFSDPIKFT